MSSLCCSSIKPYRDRPNVQPHDDKFTAFLGTYPSFSISDGTGIDSANAFIVQLVQQARDTQEPVQKRYFHCYYGDKVSPPAPASEQELKSKTSSGAEPGRSQPYRPPAITTQAEPMRRPSYTYGSGWRDQRSPTSSGPPSRRSFGPPSWVSPEVADSKPNWRNPAKPPSTTSTSTASTSPTSSRGPFGRTQGSFGFNRGGRNGVRKSPVSPRAPSSVDTSGWETASNATNSTLQNRFALLRDGASTAYDSDDNSEELDSAHVERVKAVVAQDDDDDYFPPLTPGAASRSWRKDSRLKVVEIGELQVKKSGLIKDRNSKMFICPLHDTIFELHLYVPDVTDS